MMHGNQINRLVYVAVMLLVSACSSNIPPDIRQPLDDAPKFSEVRGNAQNYLSRKIRWGGVILATENKKNASWMTIIAFPLSDNGRPRTTGQSPGRFFAVANEFLEPMVYSAQREITVIGKLLKTETAKIGEYDYEYPVIKIDEFYLWPSRPEVIDSDPPYYRPYYPFYRWPYFPHPYYHH